MIWEKFLNADGVVVISRINEDCQTVLMIKRYIWLNFIYEVKNIFEFEILYVLQYELIYTQTKVKQLI